MCGLIQQLKLGLVKKKEIMNFLTTTFDIKVFALFKAFGTRATITSRLMIVIQFQIRSLY